MKGTFTYCVALTVAVAAGSWAGDDISIPLEGGAILIEKVRFIRVNPSGSFVPVLAFTIRNQTSQPWRTLKLEFDMHGICNGERRQWSRTVVMGLGWMNELVYSEEHEELVIPLVGKVDGCTTETVKARLLLAENSKVRFDGTTGERIDLEEQRRTIKAKREAEQAAEAERKAKEAAVEVERRKRPVAGYRVVETKDLSFVGCRRLQVKVSLPQHYARDTVEQIAKAIVADLTRSQPVNAISILFYGRGTSTAGVYDVAMVEWAPNGRWGDAGSVRPGDYSSFAYSASYKAPPPARTTHLKPSDQTGLFGAPLPEGATLVERKRGDPAAGRDPSERYAISSSAAEIAAFFNEAMPVAGWAKDGISTGDVLVFRKGNIIIGVLINQDGKTFTLMGS